MTDEEFEEFCAQHPDLDFETSAEGEIIIMAPVHSLNSSRNGIISHYLFAWSLKDRRGIACDSSGGFVLPDGSRRSPDASWTLKERVASLPTQQRTRFWRLCPDFVIELRSETDRLKPLQAKMHDYIANGAQLGWLIDPTNKSVEIYRPLGAVEIKTNIEQIDGEGPVTGFHLNLAQVWDPLSD